MPPPLAFLAAVLLTDLTHPSILCSYAAEQLISPDKTTYYIRRPHCMYFCDAIHKIETTKYRRGGGGRSRVEEWVLPPR